jgi:RNA polymerase sigma-70 factor (ECF subfamily)
MAATDPEQTANPLEATDDLALVRRVVAREEAALAELYDRYASLLLAVVRRILFAGPDAEEVVQEAFLQVWLQADRYDPARSSVSTWLVLIGRSRALDRLRSRHARDRAVAAAEAEPKAPVDASSGGETHVLHTERRKRVREALGELPSEQREVLELAFFGGLSQTEISMRTGAPLGTVKTRALLGMKKLRQALREEVRELM